MKPRPCRCSDLTPAEAIEYVDLANREFREMKMQPLLKTVLRRRELLRARLGSTITSV